MRRRRNQQADQDAAERTRVAGVFNAAYQSDVPAYEEYEIYEEYDELPPQANPRASVVIPAVTLPSVSSPRIPNGNAQPHASAARHAKRVATPGAAPAARPGALRGRQAANRQPHDPDAWLNAPDPVAHRTSAGPAHHGVRRQAVHPHLGDADDSAWHNAATGHTGAVLGPRSANHHRRLSQYDRLPPSALPAGRVRRVSQRIADIVVIPVARHALPRPLRSGARHALGAVGGIARRPMLASALVLIVVALGVVANVTGAAQQAGIFSASAWHALAGLGPSANAASDTSGTPATYDVKHYMDKYGFVQPGAATAIPSDEVSRLAQMLPAAIKATTAYNKRYSRSIEPQMLLFWTHSEGIRARINYSDCANESTRAGTTYFTDIENCDHASFWQLGYGNQFSLIYILRNAFTDLYGDPNDTQLVAQVGQRILDFDKQQGTTPPCGGYSCTFPAKTIDDILSGINLDTGVMAEDNWWASVLSRDPAINCYMIAHALSYFNHDATRNWVGCYYATSCWQRESDRLGDILTAWPNLVKAAGIQG